MNAEDIERLARLIGDRNAIDRNITRIVGRPAEKGHVGEYIAAALFGIELEESAVQAGYDGHFQEGLLSGRTVNIKWYAKREGMLDIREDHLPDYFLVLAGPSEVMQSSKGQTRPWVIEEVFLFEAKPLLERLKIRGVKIGVATSVRKVEWEEARIYPGDGLSGLGFTNTARRYLSLFGDKTSERSVARGRHLSVPIWRPEDVIPHLAKGEQHWRKGYSARELAESWFLANGIPVSVKAVLDDCPDYRDAAFIDGFFEREVDLGTPGAASQTDLMVIANTSRGLAVIAVEGKVNEPFGNIVTEWNDGSASKGRRLAKLCATLGIADDVAAGLRYQLLHRTASAVYEAHRYRAMEALMLVHSFSESQESFDDYSKFAEQMGMPITEPNKISSSKECEGVALRLGWVSDIPAR